MVGVTSCVDGSFSGFWKLEVVLDISGDIVAHWKFNQDLCIIRQSTVTNTYCSVNRLKTERGLERNIKGVIKTNVNDLKTFVLLKPVDSAADLIKTMTRCCTQFNCL